MLFDSLRKSEPCLRIFFLGQFCRISPPKKPTWNHLDKWSGQKEGTGIDLGRRRKRNPERDSLRLSRARNASLVNPCWHAGGGFSPLLGFTFGWPTLESLKSSGNLAICGVQQFVIYKKAFPKLPSVESMLKMPLGTFSDFFPPPPPRTCPKPEWNLFSRLNLARRSGIWRETEQSGKCILGIPKPTSM